MRLDQALTERGLFESREKARRAVMAGLVEVGGRRVDKPGAEVAADAELRVLAPAEPFVSRGGRKLAAALDHFGVEVAGLRCLDVGASTGGFTDCLLQSGARAVIALDVGYGQLALSLRDDPRVHVIERRNVREARVHLHRLDSRSPEALIPENSSRSRESSASSHRSRGLSREATSAESKKSWFVGGYSTRVGPIS